MSEPQNRCAATPPESSPETDSPLASSGQLLVVKAGHWDSCSGQLQRFARHQLNAAWQPVGATIEVSLGRRGLAWGLGRHRPAGDGPDKREGDGRAPAGIFALSELFGYASPDSAFAGAAKLPYRCATHQLKCIDDPASAHYNQFVELDQIPHPDWTSHEDMRRDDERYAVGAVIAHNQPQPVPGAGSCIFLHVWQAAGVPTAGCTAASPADIAAICVWLDGAAQPLLIQLPEAEYARFRAAWALP
ncbi:MAG: hypothetical protein WAV95_14530 [Azonexus sp.]